MSIVEHEISRPVDGSRVRIAQLGKHYRKLGTVIDTRAGAVEEVTVHLDGLGQAEVLFATFNLDVVDELPHDPRDLAILLAVGDAEDIATHARAQFGAEAGERLLTEAERHAATSQKRSLTRLDAMRTLDGCLDDLDRLLEMRNRLDRLTAYPTDQAVTILDGLITAREAVRAVRAQVRPRGGEQR